MSPQERLDAAGEICRGLGMLDGFKKTQENIAAIIAKYEGESAEVATESFPKCISYEELRRGLGNLPQTWYPDLIRAMTEAAYKKKVFIDGGASNFVSQVEKKIGKDKK